MIPQIEASTKEERKNHIAKRFACKGNCDICGICKMYRGKDPMVIYQEYIDGTRSFQEITEEYRR